jgi:hypothetical protein
VPFALQITFVLPVLAFLTCWPLPYPPPREEILYPEPSKSLAGN